MSNAHQPSTNRRSFPRKPPRGSTVIECRRGMMGLGPNLTKSVADLSQVGTRLVLTEALAKGEEVELSLQGPGQSRPIKLLADVVRCEPAEGAGFQVGIRFRKVLAYADLQQMT